ncbi:MAG: hypothetical protein FWH03_01070 [Firmicutes bacterium]|nr:hypothetical protein [Bacillota bacterium]
MIICKSCKQINDTDAEVCIYCNKNLRKSKQTEIVNVYENAENSFFKRFYYVKLRYKLLLFFSPALFFAVYYTVSSIIDMELIVFNLVTFFIILFPSVTAVGLYVPAFKKQNKKLLTAFLGVFLFTGIASIALGIFWEGGAISLMDVYISELSAGKVAHIVFYIISMLLLIAALVFFTKEAKQLSKKIKAN